MISKAQIQLVKSLQNKKFRDAHQLYVVEGTKMVLEMLLTERPVSQLFAIEKWFEHFGKKISDNIETIKISENELSRMSSLKTPNQVLAVAKIPDNSILTSLQFADLTLLLDGMNDPGNLGTILRIADWFGIKTVICSENTVDLYNPKTIQASMGSLFRVDVYYQNLPAVIRESGHDMEVFGAFLNGKNIYREQLPTKGIIVIGSEAHGISTEVASLVKNRLFIPSFSQGAESLNASVATAIVCSEFRRRIG